MSHPLTLPLSLSESHLDSDYGAVFELELSVARRADELARTHGYDHARDFWMEAEAEVIRREFSSAA